MKIDDIEMDNEFDDAEQDEEVEKELKACRLASLAFSSALRRWDEKHRKKSGRGRRE